MRSRVLKILGMLFIAFLVPAAAFSTEFRMPERVDQQKQGDIQPFLASPKAPDSIQSVQVKQRRIPRNMHSFASSVVQGEEEPLSLFGGWKLDVTGSTEETFSWEIEKTIYGNTSLGILEAYHTYGEEENLSEVQAVGDYMLGAPLEDIQAQDTVFLNDLGQIPGNERYRFAGALRMNSISGSFTGGEMYEFYDQEPQTKHWHLAQWIEAANLYGEESWAYEKLDEVLKDQGPLGGFYFDGNQDNRGTHVSTLGQAKMVEVLHKYYRDEKPKELRAALLYLLTLQEPNGPEKGGFNWAGEDDGSTGGNSVTPFREINVKAHAYALMALKECEEMPEVTADIIENAFSYLEIKQITDYPRGGWYDWGDYLPLGVTGRNEFSEYDGEVIHALSLVGKEEHFDMVKKAYDRLCILRNKVDKIPQLQIAPAQGTFLPFMAWPFTVRGGSSHQGKIWYTWFESSGGQEAMIFPRYEEGTLPEYRWLFSELSFIAWLWTLRPGVVTIASFDENGYSTSVTIEIISWLP